MLALALFAMPLWDGWRTNAVTFRTYVAEDMQGLSDLFQREGAAALADAVRSRSSVPPRDAVILFAGPDKKVLAGNLRTWPVEVPDAPGTYGVVIDLGDNESTRIVASHVRLPGGYRLLMGRESVRFQSLVERFWYGMAAALVVVLALGAAIAGLMARRTAAVRQSEERYARAIQASNDGIWEWNPGTDEFFMSDRARQLWGLPESANVRTRADLDRLLRIHPDDVRVREDATIGSRPPAGQGFDLEYRVVGAAGDLRWVRSQGKTFPGADGRPTLMTGSITDVTERKRAELGLGTSEGRYALAMEAAGDGHTDWNLLTGEHYISPRLLEICGYAPDATFRDRAEWVRRFPFHPEDRPQWEEAVAAHFAGRESHFKMELRIVVGGKVRWTAFHFLSTRDAAGTPIRWTGSIADITEAKLAEKALRESQERYALAVGGSHDGVWDVDYVTRRVFVSARARELVGMPPGPELVSMDEWFASLPLHPDDVPLRSAAMDAHLAGKTPAYVGEFRLRQPDGVYRWRRLRGLCIRDANGNPLRMAGSVGDIDARRRAEDALKLSEERYSLAMEAAQDAHWDWIVGTDEYYTSVRAAEVLGLPPGTTFTSRQEYLAKTTLMKEDLEKWQQAARELFAGAGSRLSMELRANVSGKIRWIQHNGVVLRDASGRAVRWCGTVRDVTERRRAEESLRLSEERYARAMEASEEGHFDWNVRTDEIFASARQREVLGLPEGAEYRTRSEMNAQVRYPPGERERLEETISRILGSSDLQHESEYRVLRGEETRWLRRRWKILRDADGAALRVIGLVSDITERKLATEELRESEERFRALTELSSDWYWRQDKHLRFSYISHQGLDATGVPGNAAIGMARWEFDHVKPLSGSWDEHKAQLAARLPFRDLELGSTAPDGTVSYLSISGAPVFDEHGDFDGYQGIARSITERKHIEDELRSRQEELRRAQRLEGMGTLAGGIAHDFNNILGAILGYGEMAMRDAKEGTRLRRDLDSIMAAGERGRALVDRILAFSRSGVAERVPVHVEAVVREALDQVAASMPENVTISPRLRAGRAAILGDSTQVHQVVMNLAANAVQAMPQGGILRVALETARFTAERPVTVGSIQPGDYMVLTVGDTGTGIPEGVLERMFDPFFTTKEVGVGSGLGLSLVHGIVTSVGGAIEVATQAGKGTVFTVYLHRSGDAVEKQADERQSLPRGKGQSVLVVDDEEPLVRLATETLEDLGYAPVGFTSSTAALAAFRADPGRFDAVLTDERMPGLSGSALIREVRGIRDAIPVILMSGYLGMENLDADVIVRKPLSARDLAACMARALQA